MRSDAFHFGCLDRFISLCNELVHGRYDIDAAEDLVETAERNHYPAEVIKLAKTMAAMTIALKNRECQPSPSNRSTIPTGAAEAEKLNALLKTAGMVCHELSQPLQAISGNAELSLLDLNEDHPSYQNIERIRGEVDRMRTIVDKLSQLTRLK